jgi:hypothetical protein
MDEDSYRSLLRFIHSQGYDIDKVQKVPQVWTQNSETAHDLKEAKAQ